MRAISLCRPSFLTSSLTGSQEFSGALLLVGEASGKGVVSSVLVDREEFLRRSPLREKPFLLMRGMCGIVNESG